jgi:hypothetical protein
MSTEEKKDAQFFVRPTTEGKKPEDLADEMADGLIAQINAERLAKGLPPLEKDG